MHNAEPLTSDKTRRTGVDVEGIKEQLKEKRKQVEEDEKKQKAYAADMLHNNKVATILQSRQEKEKRAMEKAIVTYRLQHQQPWQRHEFDLNDPQRCRKTSPAEAQMMLPGLAGEDPDRKSRVERQREQLGEWLTQQQRERAAARRQLQLEEQGHDQSTEEMNNKAAQLERLEMEKRKAAAISTQEYNMAKTEEKRRADTMKQLLTDADATGLRLGSNRREPKESSQQVLQFQQQQMEERRRVELEEKREEARQERVRLDSARAALLIERQQEKLNKQLRQHLDGTNAKLAEVHKQCKPDIERGYIDDSFFSKFNTGRR